MQGVLAAEHRERTRAGGQPDDALRAAAQDLLHGSPAGVIRLPADPGTLAVFRGQHALHRVTTVSGPRPRINSVLTYGEHPGMKLNELTQKLFYGRTA